MSDWLIERLENLVSDVRNGERINLAEQADEIRRFMNVEFDSYV